METQVTYCIPSVALMAQEFRRALSESARGFVGREVLIELIGLAAISGEHILTIGPSGTGKREAVWRIAQSLGAHYFEYLMGETTTPEELFGREDPKHSIEDRRQKKILGLFAQAEIAFLDEIFLSPTSVLNPLLTLLQDRFFYLGNRKIKCPLQVLIGATSILPQDPSLLSCADQFLIRVFVDPLPDTKLEDLLEGGLWLSSWGVRKNSSIDTIAYLAQAVKKVNLQKIKPQIAQVIRLFRQAGLAISDRRIVKGQYLIAAAAVLQGREEPIGIDLWPLSFLLQTKEEQARGVEIIQSVIKDNSNEKIDHTIDFESTRVTK